MGLRDLNTKKYIVMRDCLFSQAKPEKDFLAKINSINIQKIRI